MKSLYLEKLARSNSMLNQSSETETEKVILVQSLITFSWLTYFSCWMSQPSWEWYKIVLLIIKDIHSIKFICLVQTLDWDPRISRGNSWRLLVRLTVGFELRATYENGSQSVGFLNSTLAREKFKRTADADDIDVKRKTSHRSSRRSRRSSKRKKKRTADADDIDVKQERRIARFEEVAEVLRFRRRQRRRRRRYRRSPKREARPSSQLPWQTRILERSWGNTTSQKEQRNCLSFMEEKRRRHVQPCTSSGGWRTPPASPIGTTHVSVASFMPHLETTLSNGGTIWVPIR